MLKVPFLIIFVALMGLSAHASQLKLTHDQFVHLTDAQKDEWIIKTMELMVDLENRYQREVKTSGFNQERFERYTKFMKQFQSLLMGSAYAAPVVSWETHGRNFSSLLKNSNGGANCIYAGWVSKVMKQNGKEYCVHPNFLGNANSPQTKAYARGASCEGRNKITCNPAIFGYKSEGAGSLFCVNAGLNEAHNSSYSCMKEALADAEAQGADSKEVRLRNLRNRLAQNPAIFQDVQKFVFQTCVCEATPLNLNKSYHDYMRPHRTCYGIMEMLSATVCEEPKIDFDTTFFEKLREFTNGKIIRGTSGSEVDATYTSYLNNVRSSAGEEYARLCPQDTIATKPPVINVGSQGGNPQVNTGTQVAQVPEVKTATTTPVTDLEGVKVTPDMAVTYKCVKAVCKPAAPVAAPAPTGEEAKPATAVKPEDAPKPAPSFSCEYEIVSAIDGEEEPATPTSKPTELPKSKDDKELAIKAIFGPKTEDLTCPLSFEGAEEVAAKETVKPVIKLVLKQTTDTRQFVAAETTNGDEYHIKWFRKNYPEEVKPAAKEEPKEELKFAGSSTEETPVAETAPGPEIKGHIADSDDYEEIQEPRKKEKYETCAILTAPGKESSEESCVTIPELKKSRPIVAPGGQQGQGAPPRGATNTSALGIR